MNDHRSYVHNLSSNEIEVKKNFRLERESNPDPAITGAVLSPVSYPSQQALYGKVIGSNTVQA